MSMKMKTIPFLRKYAISFSGKIKYLKPVIELIWLLIRCVVIIIVILPHNGRWSKGKSNIKLPKMHLKKFQGDSKSWMSWKDSFEAAIHDNEALEYRQV